MSFHPEGDIHISTPFPLPLRDFLGVLKDETRSAESAPEEAPTKSIRISISQIRKVSARLAHRGAYRASSSGSSQRTQLTRYLAPTSTTLPSKTRRFDSLSEAALEIGMSRVYGGIHFLHAVEDGLKLGKGIGRAVSQLLPDLER
jgi:hypothetical protein